MDRFSIELDRLYGPATGEARTRVLVLATLHPASEQLPRVWNGVQDELALPEPAIAVSGQDALQLWFSLAEPVSVADGLRFLQGLRERFLPEVPAAQLRLVTRMADLPAAPGVEVDTDRWSAFVRPDLASLFAETPWLDMPPNLEGQAAILMGLEPARPSDFEAALAGLGVVERASPATAAAPPPAALPAVGSPDASSPAATSAAGHTDPARFLAEVMNDEAAPLALRIEAARILLLDGRRG